MTPPEDATAPYEPPALARELDPGTGQPVGPRVEVKTAPGPGPVTLEGRFGRIEKLDAARHGRSLWAEVQGRPELWTYTSHGPFAAAEPFQRWLGRRAEEAADPFAYAILDHSGRALGLSSLQSVQREHRVIEVGAVLYGPSLQRTPLATEAQYLLARYVFETLGYRRYEWKCHALNAASGRAARRLGFTFEGVFRGHKIVRGRNRDTAWFSMLEGEWPARKRAFQRWLEPGNFDAAGRQRRRLGEI